MTRSRSTLLSPAVVKNGDKAKKTTEKHNLIKPTEAQLRYAQFHHKRRAQTVKRTIDKLHQTPLELEVKTIGRVSLEGIGSNNNNGDDDSLSQTNSSVATLDTLDVELKAIRLLRPKISAGRRAYLRDSKHKYRRRRREIKKHGYRGYFSDDEENAAEDTEEGFGEFASELDDEEPTDTEQQKLDTDGNNDTAAAGDLRSVFATKPKQQSSRRRQRRYKRAGGKNHKKSNDESYQRFQAACHAMMRNIETSQAATPRIAVPSKRWTRSQAHVEAATQNSLDFSRYKTSGYVKASNKNAALLLSYKYYQQNQKEFVMDKGATWLTHLPAKQSKRSRADQNYYFHDMNELPHLIRQAASFDQNNEQPSFVSADGDDNESIVTLAMRQPGPQKFHRLMAYVQHKLIEKEKQQEKLIQKVLLEKSLDANDATSTQDGSAMGQSRTKELTDFHELAIASPDTTKIPNRIRQMADSIEGKGGTPTMRLHTSTPFSGLTTASRRRRGKSRYVPRMRLQDFAVEGNDNGDEEGDNEDGPPTPLPRIKLETFLPGKDEEEFHVTESKAVKASSSLLPPPKMRLRDSVLESSETSGSTSEEVPIGTFLPGKDEEEFRFTFTESKAVKKSSLSPPPKMRLRDSVLESSDTPVSPSEEVPIGTCRTREMAMALEGPPKMRLRDSVLESSETPGSSSEEVPIGTFRTREMAMALEGSNKEEGESQQDSRVQQIRKSLEPPKNTTPTMKLKGDFERIDEKKAPDEESSPAFVSRSTVGKLSQKFNSPASTELEDFNNPTQEVVNEFSKHIDPRILKEFEGLGQSSSPSKQQRKSEGSGGGNKRVSTGSNVTEFFARMREEQQQRQNEQMQQRQQKGSSPKKKDQHPLDSFSHPASPGGHSDISDLTKGSNISGLWNRGRNSISTLTSNLNTIKETQTQKGKGLLSPEVLGRATSGLLNKFRGVPEESAVDTSSPPTIPHHPASQQIQQEEESIDRNSPPQQVQQEDELVDRNSPPQQDYDLAPKPFVNSPSIDSHDALRNYRRNRASMSPEAVETMSQASSYNELPDQIREVVQNSGGRISILSPASKTKPPRHVSPNKGSVATQSTRSPSELSSEQYKRAHDRFIENSPILREEFEHDTIIDTDNNLSFDSDDPKKMDPQVLASLMMSPDILQKRLRQAIGCVERQRWEQVSFLINANPWLAEMKELTTNQFLLHKLAYFGMGNPPAPMNLSEQLVQRFPAAVHKFDQDGNVPLHLAAASGNVEMIKMLGEKFSSGASIRNEDGMLPLHFAIASFADFHGEAGEDNSRPLQTIKSILKLFPQAVAIADNDGNLPIHVASEFLRGGVGVDIVYLLMDEAERQLEDPYGVRFRNKIKMEDLVNEDDMSQGTMSTPNRNMDDSSIMDTELHCTMVVNDFDETPLLAAIRGNKGWEMIEALVSGAGGRKAALKEDSDKNNALHLLVGEFQDATAAMSILKLVPDTALHRNAQGILPIEMACMVMMPEEVILAIALVDLPINIDDPDAIKTLKDRGESWSFLTCDCDDHMVHVVEEILSICSFKQLQELCFLKINGSEETVLDKATPKCREAMNSALRFLGRFEFLGDGPLFSDLQTGFKAFDALDFGGNEEGKPVLLECYQDKLDFEHRVHSMFDVDLDNNFVEEVNVYVEHQQDDENAKEEDVNQQQQLCVAIERPRLTLMEVVQGMEKSGGYDSNNTEKRLKYSAKICAVLKLVGKALRHLHEAGVVHGNLCMEACGKFEDSSWKLLERLGVQPIGKPFDPARFLHSFPPESLKALSAENDPQEQEGGTVFDSDRPMVSFSNDFVAEVSIDIWAFGKICYESLVGKPLIDFDREKSESASDDVMALLQTAEWNVSNMETVFANLLETGIDEAGADMITACLFPSPADRPADMDEILDNPFWQEMRKHRSPRKGRNRRSGESVSTSISLLTDVDRYEV